jgi:hypothetical protein
VQLRCGLDPDKALFALSKELNVPAEELWRTGSFTRIVVRRELPKPPPAPKAKPTALDLRNAAIAGAVYLARNLEGDGRFRYEVDARTNFASPGYNWPRHGGATHFLAEAAGHSKVPALRDAARLAARQLAEQATANCGAHRCVGDRDPADLGSSALALLAYTEVLKHGIDDSLRVPAQELAEFLRSMQRKDGEFMHLYDRSKSRPIDIQLAYYTGEAALALARHYRLSRDRRDLDAAKAALFYTANRRWKFFGSHYYFDYEHWTCQAMAELWDLAPDRGALDLCMRWQHFNRKMQVDSSRLGDFEGGFADPLTPPRLAPAGSRSEGAVATLAVMRKAGSDPEEIAALERQIERSLAFMLRYQLTPGPSFLFANPAQMFGGFPGSAIDYIVRIDYPQHVGAAMLRYADMM